MDRSDQYPSRRQIEQALVERHTEEVQQKLRHARVAVAGLGGLGSNIAVSLARLGVGCLHLVDFDRVELSNLNRQQYAIRHLGRHKTDALGEIIAEINPYIRVIAHCVRVTQDNAPELFGDDAIVCEAFDRPENKAMLVNTLLERCPDSRIVAASGMAGYGSAGAIVTRRLGERLYLCGDGITGMAPGQGLMAPLVAVCAGHQANMALRLILGEPQP